MHLVPPGTGGHAGSVQAPAPLTAECRLTDREGGLAAVRRFTRLVLRAWECEIAVEDALLVVTELATNALRHGGPNPALRLSVGPAHLRIELFDDDPVFPVRRPAGRDGGWGLALVDRLSLAWGAARHGRGKVVWCALPAELAG
jgi:hypothetical protein